MMKTMKNTFVKSTYSILLSTLLLVCTLSANANEFSLDMRNADIREFIHTIGKLTGKTIIVDAKVQGKIDIQSHQALEPDELYEVFLTQLGVSGFAVVEVDNNILKVIPTQNARMEALSVQTAKNAEGNSEAMITRIIQVEDVNVDKLVATLRPLVDNKSGVISAYSGSNVILIIDTASNVNRIVEIIREVDRADSRSLELVKLENASAQEIERMLTRLMAEEGKNKPGVRPLFSVDSRTNTLILRADTTTAAYIKRIVKDLDGEVNAEANIRVIYLKYANANEVKAVLQGVSNSILKEEISSIGASGVRGSNIHIEAHEQTNTIVLSGSPHLIGNLEQVIKKLDIRRAQVLVEAIIAELSDEKAKELGVQWLFNDGGTSGFPGAAVNFTDSTPGVISLANTDGNAFSALAATQGAVLGIGNLNFGALLHALASDSESNVLSTPSLLTMDNEEASILVGREVPIITGSTASSNNANPFQTITRKDIGVKLIVKPQINDGDTVQLQIEQEVSSLSGLTSTDLITNKRTIKTTVLVDNNTTIVLGGLMDEDVQESKSKVPFLGDLPGLGHMFRSSSSKKVKRNLMVFIRPQIVQDDVQAAQLSSEKYGYIRAEQMLRHERGIQLMGDEKPAVLPELQDTIHYLKGQEAIGILQNSAAPAAGPIKAEGKQTTLNSGKSTESSEWDAIYLDAG